MRVGTPGDTFFLGTGLGHIVFAKEQVGRTVFSIAYLYKYIGLVTGIYKAIGS